MTRSFSAVTPRIKICGLTREADVDAAVAAGADALGFVFYAKSPRAVTAARAAELVRRVPPFVTVVGLFVNPAPDEVEGVLDHVPLNLLQFHGDEGEADCRRYRRPYLKAARMKAGVDLLKYAADFPSARGLLLDTFVDGYGGSGQTFDWSLIPAPAERDFSIVRWVGCRQRGRSHSGDPAGCGGCVVRRGASRRWQGSQGHQGSAADPGIYRRGARSLKRLCQRACGKELGISHEDVDA